MAIMPRDHVSGALLMPCRQLTTFQAVSCNAPASPGCQPSWAFSPSAQTKPRASALSTAVVVAYPRLAAIILMFMPVRHLSSMDPLMLPRKVPLALAAATVFITPTKSSSI